MSRRFESEVADAAVAASWIATPVEQQRMKEEEDQEDLALRQCLALGMTAHLRGRRRQQQQRCRRMLLVVRGTIECKRGRRRKKKLSSNRDQRATMGHWRQLLGWTAHCNKTEKGKESEQARRRETEWGSRERGDIERQTKS